LCGQSLSSFVTLAADQFETLVSCAWCFSDFYGLCSDLTPVLSSFLVSVQHFMAVFLSRSDTVDQFVDACGACNCDLGKSVMKFSLTLYSRTVFQAGFIKKNKLFSSILNHIHIHSSNQYLTQCQMQLHCCVNNFSAWH
jgi:hypothetical protein